MTAATAILAARYTDPAVAVTTAQAVLERFRSGGYTWERGGEIARVADFLARSLADRAALAARGKKAGDLFPDLGDGDEAAARRRLDEDIEADLADLMLAVREAAGDEAADYLNGTDEGEKS